MRIGRKFRELMRKRLGHGPPTVIKTSVNGKPYMPRGKELLDDDRRSFLKKAGTLAGAGALGALAGMSGFPVSGTNTTNWNNGPGSLEVPADYTIFQSSNNSWYRRQGDTGSIGDSSEGDSPTTDPVPLINRTITGSANGQSISVKGNFSSSATLNFTLPVSYNHQGVHTYTGTGDAINLQETGGGQANSLYIHIFSLTGPNSVSPYNASPNAIGIHARFAYQPHIWIDNLLQFAEGVRFDVSTGNFCSDGSWKLFGFQWCNIGIHWTGSASGINMQGHLIEMHMFACKTGILIDAASNAASGFNEFFGVCANVGFGVGFQDYVNNNNRVDNGASPNLLRFTSSYTKNASVLGPLDCVIGNADYYEASSGTVTNQTTPGSHFPRIEFQQKQLGLGYVSITSLAVTFPLQEPDTSYSVLPTFNFNSGGWWIDTKSVTGCTIHTVNSNAGGTVDYMVYR